jgi:hypothetical protein
MTEMEPPSDDLRALFAQERDISDVERVAIRQKLAVSVAAPPAATATIVSSKLVWIAAAVLAAAASIWWVTQRNEPATTPVPPVIIEPAPILAPEPRITETSPEPAPPAPEAAVVTPEPAAAAPAQAELLAKAWQALDKDAAGALTLVELDAKLHARGALSEEREALHIFALVKLGRRDQARALADKFLALYPSSVHRATIERRLR